MNQRGSTLIIYAVVALAVLGTLSGIAASLYGRGKDAGKAEIQSLWDSANEAARQREAKASATAAAELAAERAKVKIVTRKRTVYVDKLVDKPVYRNVCLDDAGLRCLESAILGKSAAGCKPDGKVPAATTAD